MRILSFIALISSLSSIASARTYTFGFVGDAGMALEGMAIVKRAMVQERIKNVILTGDQLYNPNETYQDVWGGWTGQFKWFAAALGNHSLSYQAEQRFFGMPSQYYSKKAGENILFVVLNSDNVHTADEQAIWFKNLMETSTEKFIFVIQHHPPYTISRYHRWEERQYYHEVMRPLLRKYSSKIDALFTGHDHFSVVYQINDLPWIHSGSVLQHKRVGATNGEVEPGVELKTKWIYDEDYYFVRLDVDEGDGTAKASYVRARDRKRGCVVTLEPSFSLSDECSN